MTDENTLMEFEALLIREHMSDLSEDKQKEFKEKYDTLEEKDRLMVLNTISTTSRVYQEETAKENLAPSFQDGGIFSDKYGNNYTYDKRTPVSKKKTTVDSVEEKPVTKKIKKVSKVSRSATRGSDFNNQGQSQEDIKKLQRALKAQGFNPGPEDGLKGNRTDAAIAQAEAQGYGIYFENGNYTLSNQSEASVNSTPTDTTSRESSELFTNERLDLPKAPSSNSEFRTKLSNSPNSYSNTINSLENQIKGLQKNDEFGEGLPKLSVLEDKLRVAKFDLNRSQDRINSNNSKNTQLNQILLKSSQEMSSKISSIDFKKIPGKYQDVGQIGRKNVSVRKGLKTNRFQVKIGNKVKVFDNQNEIQKYLLDQAKNNQR